MHGLWSFYHKLLNTPTWIGMQNCSAKFQTIMPTMGFFGQSMVEKMDIHIQKKQPLTTSTIEKTYFY